MLNYSQGGLPDPTLWTVQYVGFIHVYLVYKN